MTIQEGLLKLLNNDEPLAKRLQIADNAFNSPEVNIKHRELFLLKWLAQTAASSNSLESWEQCLSWLSSESFRELRVVDVASNDVTFILNRIKEEFRLRNENILNALVPVVISMAESPIFQHYFRNNLEEYINFLKDIFQSCSNRQILMNLLSRHDTLFHKKFITAVNFHDIFIQHFFVGYVEILEKCLQPDNTLFECLSSIIHKNVFAKREDDFLKLFKALWENTDDELNTVALQMLLDKLSVGKKSNLIYTYHSHRLLYSAFCKGFKSNPTLCYHFFAYLMQNLGFASDKLNVTPNSSARLEVALSGMVAMLEVISSNNFRFESTINELSFSDLLQNLLLCIINVTKLPINNNCFDIINLILKISPLTIEANISPLLIYLMSPNNDGYATTYSTTLCNVLELFFKLHRVQTLVSKLIRALQPIYLDGTSAKHAQPLENFRFDGKVTKCLRESIDAKFGNVELDVSKMLPSLVLEQFSVGSSNLAAKQMSNMFKTFTFHLDELIGHDLAEKSKKASYVTFIELISQLLCHYLAKMNIASSNFRATHVLDKITNHIDEMQGILEKFGNALVVIEHNQNLMCVFLQLSYTWGELKILVHNAIVNESESPHGASSEVKDVELSSCNITALHSYLSSQTWCLIAERISNFGEQPCKKIIERMWIQKIRFLILSGLDPITTNEHVATLIKTITPIEDYYEYLLSNEFASHAILTRMDASSLVIIAECTLKDAIQNATILQHAIENRHFILALVYVILKKLNKSLKKDAKSVGRELISSAVFSRIGENILEMEVDLEAINMQDVFVRGLEKKEDTNSTSVILNLEMFSQYFSLIKQLPIVFLDMPSQVLVFYYLLGVFLDAKSEKQNGCAVAELETILIGLAQARIICIDSILPMTIIVETVTSQFDRYQELFSIIFANGTMNGTSFNIALEYLSKHLNDDKQVRCLLILMKNVQKHKKSSQFMNVLEGSLIHLNKSLLTLIATENMQNRSQYLELLTECLLSGKVPITDDIVTQLQNHLSKIFTDKLEICQGVLLLFHFALTNDKFKSSAGDDHKELILKVGKSLVDVELQQDILYMYATNLVFVLQKIESLDEFKQLLEQILQRAVTFVETQNQFKLEVKLWQQLLSSSMKSNKAEILPKIFERLLVTIFNKIVDTQYDGATKEDISNVLIDFEIQLLQNTQHSLTATTVDLCFATITERILAAKNNTYFETSYKRSIEILEAMLKYRQAMICDRLNVFLQEYDMLLGALCANSDTTNKQHDDKHLDKMAELAHLLEKLTINLCKLKTHVASVAIYVIANILKEYETITIYPAVKLALNNCIYNLLALCNQHGIACLMRTLSPGSTEIFKLAYENYKKHRFTGKV